MPHRNVVLAAPVRTAIGTFGGSLKEIPATELAATAIRAVLRRTRLDCSKVETLVMGNVIQAGNKMNPARQAAIYARLAGRGAGDDGQPRLRLGRPSHRFGGAGDHGSVMVDCAIAGGMENMDQAPYLMGGGRWGYRLGNAEIYDSMLRDGLNDAFSDKHSGWHTEDLVTRADHARGARPLG